MNVFKLFGEFAIKGVDKATGDIDAVTSKAKTGFKEAEGASESASSGISGHFGKLGGALGTVAKVGIAAVATASLVAATAVGGIAKSSLEAYSSFEQLTGGVETLFKESAPAVEEYAANAYKTAGMSANDYMETVTSFSASLLQGLGGDTAAATEYADMAITDMSDNANKMGTGISSIQDAYQGFAKQNYTMLDNLKLGYGGTQSEMARLINDSGVLGDTMTVTAENVNEVSFDKIIEAIHTVQDNMGITGTTAEEAATTIEGSVNSAKAAWTNWITGLADDNANMEELTSQLVDSVVTAANNILPRIAVILSTLGSTLMAELPNIFEQLKTVIIEHGPPILDAAGQLFSNILQGLIDYSPQILEAAGQLLMFLGTAILDSLPGLLENITMWVSETCQYIIDNREAIVDAGIQMFGGLLVSLLENAPQLVGALAVTIASLIAVLVERAGEWLAQGADMFVQMVAGWLSVDVIGPFMGIVDSIKQAAVDTWANMQSDAANAWSTLCSNVDAAGQNMASLAKGAFDIMTGNASTDSQFLKDTVSGAFSAMNQATGGRLGEMVSTVYGKFQEIKSAIEGPINTARDIVGNAIDAIKGFFNFDIQWPYIPTPHFWASGSINPLDWLDGGVPQIGIDWYAKAMDDGMIMNEPTVFGYNPATNQLMAGGEAGSETVVGTDNLMQMIQGAVNSGKVVELLMAILAAINGLACGITINVSARDGKSAKEIAQEIYELSQRSQRSFA